MRRLIRPILGASVLVISAPVLAVTMLSGPEPDSGAESTQSPPQSLVLAAEDGPPELLADDAPASTSKVTVPPPLTAAAASEAEDAEEETTTTVEPDEDSTTTAPAEGTEETTTTEGSDAGKTTTTTKPKPPKFVLGDTTTTSKPKATTTTTKPKATTTTTDPEPIVVQGQITGTACPCTVTGTVELKGTVNLKGDLMVNGGTLVARPGVKVNGNGHQIMFMNGGRADFQGTKTSTWSGNGSNANTQRDIEFDNLRRIMFHKGAGKSTLKYFEVNNSGTGALGDYPLHWHLNGNSTRGTLVEGVVVANSAHHAFVPHGSHGITFKDTIAKNTRCAAYWWDQPEFQSQDQSNNSNDIVYDHALADGVTNCIGDNRGFRLGAFELGAGKNNTVRNSVARNIKPSHVKDCSGFFWPELHHGQPTSWNFSNNATYNSACNGIFVWQNDSEEHIIKGFKGDGIDHGAYLNRYDYRNVDVDFVEVHAVGWSVTGGSIDRVETFRHNLQGNPVVFKDVEIGSFTVNNGSNGGSLSATYELINTGLSCSDIVYKSVVGGTKVIVNGKTC